MARKTYTLQTFLASSDNLTTRQATAAVMTLALPAIIEQVMLTLVQYVDTAMVGSIGAQATAAVGLTATTTWLIGGLLGAAAVGFSVQVAQYVGAGQADRAKEVVAQALRFVLLFGVAIGLLAFGLAGPLPRLLGADEELVAPATAYFRIVSVGLPFNFCMAMLSAILRCSGDAKTPLVLNVAVNVLNMFFNFLFIYPTRQLRLLGRSYTVWGAGLGVEGGAWGTVLAEVIVALLFVLVVCGKASPIRPEKGRKYPFTAWCLGTVWRLGLPVALERCLMSFAQVVITALISGIGVVAVAANHLAVTAESLSYMPAYGVASAATALVGQSLGAGRKDLAKRFGNISTVLGVIIMTFGGVLLFLLAEPLITLFTPDADVIELGAQVLRIVAFAEPFFAMSIVITGVLRGAGDTKMPFLLGLASMWCVRITLSLLLTSRLGLVGVWIAMAVELFVRGVLFLIRMLHSGWLNIDLVAVKE